MFPLVKTFVHEFIVNFYNCFERIVMPHPVLFPLGTSHNRRCPVWRNREPYVVSQRCIPEYRRGYRLSVPSAFGTPQCRFSRS